MISKLGTSLLVAVVSLLIATPMTASAAGLTPAQQKKVKKLEKQLNALKNRAAPASKVKNLVNNLSKLNPVKAGTYYNTGTQKLALTIPNKTLAKGLATSVKGFVNKSKLTKAQKTKAIKAVDKAYAKFSPTPVSPTAMLLPSSPVGRG